MPVWNGQDAWHATITNLLDTPEGDHIRRHTAGSPVSRKTLHRVAAADAAAADRATGRGITTAHQTVALLLGISKKTVQRARHILQQLGLAKTITPGRYLTTQERAQAKRLHGGHQTRAASRRNLTTPTPTPTPTHPTTHTSPEKQKKVHLPRRGEVFKPSLLRRNSSTRIRAEESVAPLPPATNTRSQKLSRNHADRAPQPLELLKLAAQLVQALPRIGQHQHLGAVAHMLTRVGIDANRWSSAESLINTINHGHTQHKLPRTYTSAEQKTPLAYLAWQIKTTINPNDPTPKETAHKAAEVRAAYRAAYAAEQAAEQTRIENINPNDANDFFKEDRKRYPRPPKIKRLQIST